MPNALAKRLKRNLNTRTRFERDVLTITLEAELDTVRIEDVPDNELLKASDMPSQRMKEAVESLRAQLLAQQAMLTQD